MPIYAHIYIQQSCKDNKNSNKKKAWPILQNDPKYGKMFNKNPQFIYRRGRNISNYLVRPDLVGKNLSRPSQYNNRRGTFPCLGCMNRTSIIKGPQICHPTKGYNIQFNERVI